jgi:hypothetical protein
MVVFQLHAFYIHVDPCDKKRKKIFLPRMCVTSWHCQYRVYKIFNCKQSVFLMSLYLQGVYLVKPLMALKLKAMMNIVVMVKRKQPQAQAQKVKQECRLSYGLGSYMQLLEEGVHGYATYKASPNDNVDDELTSLVKDLYISESENFIIYNLCAKLDE